MSHPAGSPREMGAGHARGPLLGLLLFASAKYRNDVVNRDNEELVVMFQIHRDRAFGVKENLVVLPQWQFFVVFDHGADRDNPACDGGDLSGIRKRNATPRLAFGFVFSYKHPISNRFNMLESRRFLLSHFCAGALCF